MAESSLHTSIPATLAEEKAKAHEFYAEPTQALSLTFRILFGLCAIVVGVVQVTIKQLLLPAQVAFIDPQHMDTAFALVASIGAAVGVITAPLAGALSDRTTLRWGRRRPWLLFGLALGIGGQLTMSLAHSILQLLIGEIIVQIALDSILSATTAIIPDRVPQKQRAVAAAFIGMAPIVGGLVGLLLVTRFTDAVHHPEMGYIVQIIASIVLMAPFLLILREPQLPREALPPFNFKRFLASFWVSPRKYPDFAFTLASRLLVFLGYTLLISYILHYLQYVIHLPSADKSVATFQLISTLILIVSAVGGGILTDRFRRLKLSIIIAAIIMAVALLILAFVPRWPAIMLSSVILGIGFGAYLSVDIALAIRVLPTTASSGKDLGLINTGIFLPLILSPIIGALVLNTTHSYALLFAIAALSFLGAAALILPLKSVR